MQEAKDLIQIKDLHKVFKIKGRDVVALEGSISASGKESFSALSGFPALARVRWCAVSTSLKSHQAAV